MAKFARLFVAATALALLVGVQTAAAGTIGPTCSTCQGSIYTLTNLGLSPTDLKTSDGTFDTYRILLSIDTSGYTGGGVRIDEVAVKVSSSADAATLVSTPGGGLWTLYGGGLNANGCSGSGSGFECADWKSGSGAVVNGSILTWTFDIDISKGPLTGLDPASIKVRYVDLSGNKVGALVSEDITLTTDTPPAPVPEPGTLTLLALGGAGLLTRLRRRAVTA